MPPNLPNKRDNNTMAGAHKASPSTPISGGGRSKKSSTTTTTTKSLIIKLKLPSSQLAKFQPAGAAAAEVVKTEQPDAKPPSSSSISSSHSDSKAPTASPLAEGEASSGNTPVPSGTDDSVAMPPPGEGSAAVGKSGKGGKKRASLLVDGVVKPRGKPGPKKRKL